ncbi:MAG TPA: DUF3501 family protein [Burkholderiaceae bacterium]|nr:DUF3501 family protein [Burkholderiaceae bacterium]
MSSELQRIEALAAGLLSLQAYEPARNANRRHMIAYRRARTLELGRCMRLQFEDALTLRYQVQEVLRAERIAHAQGVRDELGIYAHLLPDESNWKATLFIELPDAALRARMLPMLSRAAHRIRLDIDGQRVPAFANEDLAAGSNARHLERPSGVHFLRFELSSQARAAIHAGAIATLRCDDPACPLRQPIPTPLLDLLRKQTAPGRDAESAPAMPSSPRRTLERLAT